MTRARRQLRGQWRPSPRLIAIDYGVLPVANGEPGTGVNPRCAAASCGPSRQPPQVRSAIFTAHGVGGPSTDPAVLRAPERCGIDA